MKMPWWGILLIRAGDARARRHRGLRVGTSPTGEGLQLVTEFIFPYRDQNKVLHEITVEAETYEDAAVIAHQKMIDGEDK